MKGFVQNRLVELERLAASIEVEIRKEKQRIASLPKEKRPPGRPWGEPGHGTENDYQRERWHRRMHGGPEPDEVCKAAHALHERRRLRDARALRRLEDTA